MKYTTVFWDWNGTIIDDLGASIKSVNGLLEKRNMKTFSTPEEYFDVFCFPVSKYYEKAGFDFEKEPFELLAKEYIENYKSLCKDCKVFDDVMRLIKYFKKAGVRQIMLTASEKDELLCWISSLAIRKYFDDVIGNDNIYAIGKADIAVRWLENNRDTDINKCLMIGDTVHDYEVACAMDVDCVLIARGHNMKRDLLSTGVPVFENAMDLAEYFSIQM